MAFVFGHTDSARVLCLLVKYVSAMLKNYYDTHFALNVKIRKKASRQNRVWSLKLCLMVPKVPVS